MHGSMMVTRRHALAGGLGMASLLVLRPALAVPAEMTAAIAELTGNAPLRRGRVVLELPPLVENGNSVSVTVKVPDSPMTPADHVRRLAIFTEQNPQPNVAVFHLGPRNGRAVASTRMRLATSQTVVALAGLSDGSWWTDQVDVIVTLAACVEG